MSDIVMEHAAMRINARLDESAQKQLEYLAQATGQSVSDVVRESLARYYAEVRNERGGLLHFAKMIGQGDSGRSDLASKYKQIISDSLAAKHGLGPE
jgi:Ribbon-helix-helix protein, copG family